MIPKSVGISLRPKSASNLRDRSLESFRFCLITDQCRFEQFRVSTPSSRHSARIVPHDGQRLKRTPGMGARGGFVWIDGAELRERDRHLAALPTDLHKHVVLTRILHGHT